ncbi:hypothetical protein HOT36_gp19 [Ralstonia phage RPSC1]|uniref:Uncharacterized protein n=1 Tax=Ralstonia phage RPSC1 TaxID=2041351 RepID=A0A2Z2U7W0_9CAUD|nr:hypothetical protein HOT36_gp19 [Ralstonia phage RPSC1]ATN92949.1 hypothetical protein RPSC1_18 [Ralstonia phage RPSC1]
MTHTNVHFTKTVKPQRRGLGFDDTAVKLRTQADNRHTLRLRKTELHLARNLKKEYQHG